MDPKPRPNHAIYLEALHRMTPEQALLERVIHALAAIREAVGR